MADLWRCRSCAYYVTDDGVNPDLNGGCPGCGKKMWSREEVVPASELAEEREHADELAKAATTFVNTGEGPLVGRIQEHNGRRHRQRRESSTEGSAE